MKLTNTLNMKRKAGMTLLELTVVILVLLSLITILFIGARAWKKGSDRSSNLINIRNCQQAMRGHQNTRQLIDGDGFTQTMLEDYMKFPTPPIAALTYAPGTVVTATGALWLTVTGVGSGVGETYGFKAATDYSEW